MTSIEWLASKLSITFNTMYAEEIQQAKQMHKKEIIDASNGYTTTELLGVTKGEYYYQETFVSKGSDDLTKEIIDFMKKEKQLKAQLPKQEISDEEIEDIASKIGIASNIANAYWIDGAKWYREQLKQKQ